MNLRDHIKDLEAKNQLIKIKKQVSTDYEMANILAALDSKPVIFENIKNHNTKVIGNLYSSRDLVAHALETKKENIIHTFSKAIDNLKPPKIIGHAPCQEIIEKEVDLKKLPVMKYLKKDGGPYIPSAIAVIKDPKLGRNVCFHRLMLKDKNKLTARLVENRGTHNALEDSKDGIEIAICIGNSAAVLLAAATSLKPEQDEFSLANAIEKTDLVKCKTVDLEVPAESEIILEGKITKKTSKEGPFLDLTETYDHAREQPVIEITCITRRKDAIYQTLLPGLTEHKILMGMPKEPTIYNEVKKVCNCKNILLTPGGIGWLHAVIQIKKEKHDDAKQAIDAAFRGHNSLKHCTIVDDDIDIHNPNSVEWAIATRFQGNKDTKIMQNQPGSSLDPSADHKKGQKTKTCKIGIDATIPFEKNRESFKKTPYPKVDLKKYLD